MYLTILLWLEEEEEGVYKLLPAFTSFCTLLPSQPYGALFRWSLSVFLESCTSSATQQLQPFLVKYSPQRMSWYRIKDGSFLSRNGI